MKTICGVLWWCVLLHAARHANLLFYFQVFTGRNRDVPARSLYPRQIHRHFLGLTYRAANRGVYFRQVLDVLESHMLFSSIRSEAGHECKI